ncbi:MAG TPA: ATP12 family protein [Allosphingosinicella sp.]|jgi:chaperone required for assembly of F1-ATPase|nr:ATP12 family protein [Allosphingosinicella sp.]
MKRFYKQATVSLEAGAVAVLLDGRPVRTPGRNLLRVPTEELAEAIAEEWNSQGEKIEPHLMPLTGLANAAIDRVAPDPAAFGRTLAEYGESDLLCYRAEGPKSLVERQARLWDPLLDWARTRFAIEIETTAGIMHRRQPAHTVEQLGRAVAARGVFQLAGLAPLVTVAGSLIIALALAEGAIGLEAAWDAAMLDEAWQAEQWGADPLAAASLANRRRDFESAYRFLTLL